MCNALSGCALPGKAGLSEAAAVSGDVTFIPSCLEIPVNICSS